MLKFLRTFGVLLASCALTLPALAGTTQITVKDSAGVTQSFDVTADGSGFFLQQGVICDYLAGANCATVDTAHGLTVKGEGTAGTATGGVLTVQGVASMTPLLATGTGTAGSAAAGVLSVQGIASMTPLLVTPSAPGDPCFAGTKTDVAIATATGTTQLVAPSGSTQVYVCSFSLIAAATAVVNLVGGTGASCTTGTPVAVLGSTTAASGASLAANGGLTFGSGAGTVARTITAGHGLCLIQSGTTALAGNITYVQQ